MRVCIEKAVSHYHTTVELMYTGEKFEIQILFNKLH